MKRQKIKSPGRSELVSLIHNIGGEEKLFKILKDFYERMSKDLLIGFFFENHDLEKIAQMQRGFILNAAGLAPYQGKGPSTAHVALPPILSGHFDRRLMILSETLEAHDLSASDLKLWLQFEESFREMVVSK
jgi:truncated hemoglobin YjbI